MPNMSRPLLCSLPPHMCAHAQSHPSTEIVLLQALTCLAIGKDGAVEALAEALQHPGHQLIVQGTVCCSCVCLVPAHPG